MKVAYNACYGGFNLSVKATKLGRELSGNSEWGGPCIKGDTYEDGTKVENDYGASFYDDSERADPILIEVIEKLGSEEASGFCSKLAIEEIPDGASFEIDEYDGFESVVPPRQSW